MTITKMVSKYIQSTERVLTEIKIIHGSLHINEEKVKGVIEHAKHYLEDAKYYRGENKLEISLASIAYCEGLLDALQLLGGVKFSWSAEKGEKLF